MAEWKEYSGSDEQIAEIKESFNSHGFITSRTSGIRWNKQSVPTHAALFNLLKLTDEYFVIPDDPLREMKIQQAKTGQPVWVKEGKHHRHPFVYVTSYPTWNIPNAEYSFTEFKEEV